MRKLWVVLVFGLLFGLGFAQEYSYSLDDAKEIVSGYIFQGEQGSIVPASPVYVNEKVFWVIEAVSFNQVNVMFPVNAETGIIEAGDDAKQAIKVHYLANFFATDDSVSDFLDDEKSFAQQRQDAFSAALQSLEVYEQQLDNVSLSTLQPLKNSLQDAVSKAEKVRSTAIDAKKSFTQISTPEDIGKTKTLLDDFFNADEAFLRACEDVSKKAGEFETELAGNDYLKQEKPDLLQAFQGVIVSYSLKQSVTAKQDSLSETKASIDAFFESLDAKADDYLVRLENRLASSQDKQRIDEIMKSLEDYSNKYANFTSQANAKGIPDDYKNLGSKLKQYYSLLNESYSLCSSSKLEDCEQAALNFDSLDKLGSSIESIISSYKAVECVEGEVRACTVDGKRGTQKCVNGSWSECVVGGFNTFWVVLGVLVVAVVLYYYSTRKKKEEPETPVWQQGV